MTFQAVVWATEIERQLVPARETLSKPGWVVDGREIHLLCVKGFTTDGIEVDLEIAMPAVNDAGEELDPFDQWYADDEGMLHDG